MPIITHQELLAGANEIKNETVKGANTATRVGTYLVDSLEHVSNPIKPQLYFEHNKKHLIIDCSGINLENVALQVVYWNKKNKQWRPASGAGVQPVFFVPGSPPVSVNFNQVNLTDVTTIRCKRSISVNRSLIDLSNTPDADALFTDIFLPFHNLKQYSFFDRAFNVTTARSLMVRNTYRPKTSYHYQSILKTGLAITKSTLVNGKVKTFILSDPLKFNIYKDSAQTVLTVSFKDRIINYNL